MEYSLNRENRRYNNPSLIFAFPYDLAKEFPDDEYYTENGVVKKI